MKQQKDWRKLIFGLSMAILVSLMMTPKAFAKSNNPCEVQSVAEPVVCINHENPKDVILRFPNAQNRSPRKDSVAVPTDEPLNVVVYNTQTALFTYAASSSPIELKTLEELQKFTGGLGAYLQEAATRLGGPLEPLDISVPLTAECSWTPSQKDAYTAQILAVRGIFRDTRQLAGVQTTIASAIRDVQQAAFWARRYAETLEDTKPAGRTRLAETFENGGKLEAYEELVKAYTTLESLRVSIDEGRQLVNSLRALASELSKTPPQPNCNPAARELAKQATNLKERVNSFQQLIASREKVLREAAAIEDFGWSLLQSKTYWKAPKPLKLDFDTGQKLTVVVKRSGDARLARAKSEKKPFETTLKVLPDNLVRPAVSLALLYADAAEFPEFGTRKTDDDLFEIVEKDRVDRRAAYALGLSLTFRGLDRRDRGGSFAYWPLELYVNPSDNDRALGIGQAVSWKALKLNAGVLWTRHKVLDDGLAVGDLLDAEGALKTRDSFGSPEFYVGISITGWAPFKK